jgi:toxin ParE1/3/4
VSYRLIRKAEDDLSQILAYLDERNPAAAVDYHRRFLEAFTYLDQYPRNGQSQPEIGSGIRHWVIKPFRVFYRLTDDGVEIVRVLHRARNVASDALS